MNSASLLADAGHSLSGVSRSLLSPMLRSDRIHLWHRSFGRFRDAVLLEAVAKNTISPLPLWFCQVRNSRDDDSLAHAHRWCSWHRVPLLPSSGPELGHVSIHPSTRSTLRYSFPSIVSGTTCAVHRTCPWTSRGCARSKCCLVRCYQCFVQGVALPHYKEGRG